MGLAGAGLVLGMAAAWTGARLASSSFTAVRPSDPESYLAAALFTLLIALAAVAVPAWRALRVDPIVALRNN
jgi:putative ABC transport system permease protein